VRAPLAWERTRGSDEVVVAVVDGGCHVQHPDLQRRLWVRPSVWPEPIARTSSPVGPIHGWDFVGDDATLDAPEGGVAAHLVCHGTHVASLVAGDGGPDGSGVWGVAPGCRVMPLRVTPTDDRMTARAIHFAVDNGARIITMNVGYHPAIVAGTFQQARDGVPRRGDFAVPVDQQLRDACTYAWRSGCVLLCCASDNQNRELLKYPPAFDTVMAVAASDRSGQRSGFSSFGDFIEIAAPGGGRSLGQPEVEQIYAAWTPAGYGYSSGQCMAAPHAAGVAALVASLHPTFSNEQIRQILRNTALGPSGGAGWDRYIGHGIVDAQQAVRIDVAETRLAIGPDDLRIARLPDGRVELAATVHNRGVMDAPSVYVTFWIGPPESAHPADAGSAPYLAGYSGPGAQLGYARVAVTGLESAVAVIAVDAYPGDEALYVVVDPLGASSANPYLADPTPLAAWKRPSRMR
jgi:subtilisin family serine protease